MTTNRWIIFATILLFSEVSVAQVNYIPGNIVDNKGDTLNGVIDYRNWEKNPDEILFKANSNDEATIFTPLDILSFTVADELYISGIVDLEKSPRNTNDINYNSTFDLIQDTIFLQGIIIGEKSLLYVKNRYGNDNYYLGNDGKFDLLLYKKYLLEDNTLAENNYYLRQLQYAFVDCHEIQKTLEKTTYIYDNLKRLFSAYYRCTSAEESFVKEEEKILFKPGIVVGASQTWLFFDSELSGQDFITRAKYAKTVNATFGVSLNMLLARNQRKWSIYNELLFHSYTISGENDLSANFPYFAKYTFELGLNQIQLTNLVRFTYPIGQASVFANVGFANGILVSQKVNLITKRNANNGGKESFEFTEEPFIRREFIKVAGAGILFRKISLEIRYQNGNGFTPDPSLLMSERKLSALINYTF